MLRAILNKSWRQHPTQQQLYGHLTPITKTIQVRRSRHAGHFWRSSDKLISDILQWTPSHGRTKAGQPVGTCIQQLRADAGCSLEDLPGAMDNREGWKERVREIRAGGAIMIMIMTVNYMRVSKVSVFFYLRILGETPESFCIFSEPYVMFYLWYLLLILLLAVFIFTSVIAFV